MSREDMTTVERVGCPRVKRGALDPRVTAASVNKTTGKHIDPLWLQTNNKFRSAYSHRAKEPSNFDVLTDCISVVFVQWR